MYRNDIWDSSGGYVGLQSAIRGRRADVGPPAAVQMAPFTPIPAREQLNGVFFTGLDN